MSLRRLSAALVLFPTLIACDGIAPTEDPPPAIEQGALVTSIVAEKELFITNLSVVNDPKSTTYKPGKFDTTADGIWSFGRLIDNLTTKKKPSDADRSTFVMRWLRTWESPQTVNGQQIAPRPLVRSMLIDPWKQRSVGKLGNKSSDCAAGPASDFVCKLSFAPGDVPFDLIAIVFRPDLRTVGTGGASTGTSAGQGRFIFVLVDPNANPLPFTVIFEYSIPANSQNDIALMAQEVHRLGAMPFGPHFNEAVAGMTPAFMGQGIAPWRQNGSAILQVRTNDVMFAEPGSDPSHPFGVLWELREFVLGSDGFLRNDTMKQEPPIALTGTDELGRWVADNEAAIMSNTHVIPPTFEGEPFLAASSLAPFDFRWDVPGVDEPLRYNFALQTCNGRHVNETGTQFLHAFPFTPGAEATLSPWLADQISPTGARTQEYITLLNTPAQSIKTGKKKDHR